MRTRTREKKKELPLYLVVILIAFAVIGFSSLVFYYITFLPVPYSVEPLKERFLVALQLEDMLYREHDMVVVEKEGTMIYREPEEGAEEIREARGDMLYRKMEEKEDWMKIRRRDGLVEGWIKSEFVRIIES